MLKWFLLIFFGLASFSALSVSYKIEICAIQSHINGNAFIQPCPDTSGKKWYSRNRCSAGDWISWSMSNIGGQVMYSTGLAAYTTGATVELNLDGSSCHGAYDTTEVIRLVK
ncbi:hypothetical protein [Pseudoalteromonas luteoviolacea]|uniref:Uncharacterized protein n=1 Tax=Pseudoalteromonas luteoviolacea S4054 TaxID=1129367 RepID=A0A0F6A6W5_9GAMM|nr:hypothetical protein [Pseudoalteromonas luteoviolacea]AOT07739.1 hypothetical protein S4054249_07735 [Pseudoalteromonas luteoviolacea]AOT12655.1 hypothetical protein S40542_07735 [Pseudoalteromonas luteoviolacea]AOT17568.1 hypothetical protein S4054_07730 [Pseudoalteromonas luteoviolacea]KKE81596.1 hypothetical protein N479_22120 [Pseudoalteromonas luteoviolacea S4054]KZN78868.1 hypothetical protein N481_00065 [Pseudoalteromonas luteoviolacea S4047-1]